MMTEHYLSPEHSIKFYIHILIASKIVLHDEYNSYYKPISHNAEFEFMQKII